MITIKASGNTKHLDEFLSRMQKSDFFNILEKYGAMGVDALSNATPVASGETAASWYYEITHSKGLHMIVWRNRNVNNGEIIALLIQYGHGTGTGGYVVGRDYINPVVRPLFDKIANEVWEKVTYG